MDLVTVAATSTEPSPPAAAAPAAPSPTPTAQVIAVETAGVAEVAREQGAQSVTLEALSGLVTAQQSDLNSLRLELTSLRERQQTQGAAVEAVIAEVIEDEPTADQESEVEEVTPIPVEEKSAVITSAAASGTPTPRRERGPLLRMFLGKLT